MKYSLAPCSRHPYREAPTLSTESFFVWVSPFSLTPIGSSPLQFARCRYLLQFLTPPLTKTRKSLFPLIHFFSCTTMNQTNYVIQGLVHYYLYALLLCTILIKSYHLITLSLIWQPFASGAPPIYISDTSSAYCTVAFL